MKADGFLRWLQRSWLWLALLLVLFLCAAPALRWTPHIGLMERLPAYAYLGTWLQGVATLAALIIATLAFRSQSEAAKKQMAAQLEANRTANRALFMTNADRFTQHIAYRALCAIVDGTPADPTQDPKVRSDVFNAMANMFKGFPADVFMEPIPGHELHFLDTIQHSTHYLVLQRDIDEILAAARDAGLAMLLDNRISRIRDGIKANPPMPAPNGPSDNGSA